MSNTITSNLCENIFKNTNNRYIEQKTKNNEGVDARQQFKIAEIEYKNDDVKSSNFLTEAYIGKL
jgi:hypothetical protein